MVWLGVAAKNFYAKHIGFLMKPNVNWPAAILFYILFIAGIVVFVVAPAIEKGSWVRALLLGALFGLITYATYDLTKPCHAQELASYGDGGGLDLGYGIGSFRIGRNLPHRGEDRCMNYYLTLALLLWGYMSLWFGISLVKGRNDVADVAWGLGFVLLAWTSFFLVGASGRRGILVGVLVSIWGLRLAGHIHARNRGKAEDNRYMAWRSEWGKWFYPRSYAQVYLLQGALLFLIALPVLIINRRAGGRFSLLDGIGVCVWLLGFLFESVGDAELARFVKNPLNRGKILQSGLWRYTRHPKDECVLLFPAFMAGLA